MRAEESRRRVAEFSRRMLHDRLVAGTSGNISAIDEASGLIAITPSGVDYERLAPESITLLDRDGRVVEGDLEPSSETPMHLHIYRRRPETRAIVHTHSMYATTLAVLGRGIPVMHYMVLLLGDSVPVAEYAVYGSEQLAENAVRALGAERKAVLLANHGAVTVGGSLDEAYRNALLLESMAELYWRAVLAGEPRLLSEAEVEEASRQLKGYGAARLRTRP
ncbi:MAG: class II aldolase/adducin family protein [Bacillota bacterium]|nr:class II aldolase/adducin family protein [Bacillota bacterium]